MDILGFDIGGANLKAAFLRTEERKVKELQTTITYFPIWQRGKKELPEALKHLKDQLLPVPNVDAVGVTMTAELSDAYATKQEGVLHILDALTSLFEGPSIFVLDVDTSLRSVQDAKRHPMKVAAANWAATGWMISQLIEHGIVIDVGSTTTSIIPIHHASVAATGKTDLEKLQTGELVYTGSLRTNVATIVDSIPIRGRQTRVSSELFATSGDVHLLLGHITKEEFTTETADRRGKSKEAAMARLARVVCADVDMLAKEEILSIARYIYNAQLQQVKSGISQVYSWLASQGGASCKIVVTGLGRNFLAKPAALQCGLHQIINLEKEIGNKAIMTPSVGVAFMTANRLAEETIQWMG